MTKMFKVKWGASSPIEVTAEIPEYPNVDSDGDTIFENTHFLTLEEAWQKQLIECDAGVSLGCTRVKQVSGELVTAEANLVTATLERSNAIEKHRDWLRAYGGSGEL